MGKTEQDSQIHYSCDILRMSLKLIRTESTWENDDKTYTSYALSTYLKLQESK
jgi:hypothetical protein